MLQVDATSIWRKGLQGISSFVDLTFETNRKCSLQDYPTAQTTLACVKMILTATLLIEAVGSVSCITDLSLAAHRYPARAALLL